MSNILMRCYLADILVDMQICSNAYVHRQTRHSRYADGLPKDLVVILTCTDYGELMKLR